DHRALEAAVAGEGFIVMQRIGIAAQAAESGHVLGAHAELGELGPIGFNGHAAPPPCTDQDAWAGAPRRGCSLKSAVRLYCDQVVFRHARAAARSEERRVGKAGRW